MAAEFNLDNILFDTFYKNDAEGIERVIIEIGAATPTFFSFSELFRTKGWKVISVEPNPIFCDTHRERGYEIYQFACGEKDEDQVDFYAVKSDHEHISYEAFSSLGMNENFKNMYLGWGPTSTVETLKVNVRKLDTILTTFEPTVKKVDIISVDVEGWEIPVMMGFNTEIYQPDIVVLENLFDLEQYRNYMNSIDYSVWRKFTHNEVYIRNSAALV